MTRMNFKSYKDRQFWKFLIYPLLICALVGFVLIFELLGNRSISNRWDWDIHEISVLKTSIVMSFCYLLLLDFLPRAKRRRSEFSSSLESTSKPDGEEEAKRDRQRQKMVATAFSLGLILGLIGVGLDLAWKGWRVFADQTGFDLIAMPFLFTLVATVATRLPGDPFLPWRRVRFHVASLMLGVAYLALILGVRANTRQLGYRALEYHTKRKAASRSIEFNREFVDQVASRNPGNQQLLASLRNQLRYDRMLAAKYKRAEEHPWERVEPDPPRPN